MKKDAMHVSKSRAKFINLFLQIKMKCKMGFLCYVAILIFMN